jgi:hypothetical protein
MVAGRRAQLWGAALALVLGATRFAWLGRPSLWIDEAHTLHDAWAQAGQAGAAVERYPLGFWLVRAGSALRGGSIDESALRLGPALIGWLGVPLCAWAVSPAVGGARALASACVLACSAWHLYWSQNARGYTLMAGLFLWGLGLWLRGGGVRSAIALALMALAALAHPSALLGLLAFALARALVVRPSPERAGGRPAWPLLLAAVALAALAWWGFSSWSHFLQFKRVDPLAGARHLVLSCGYHFGPLLLLAASLGALAACRTHSAAAVSRSQARAQFQERQLALALALAALGALGLALVAQASAQYLFAFLPCAAALATGALPSRRLVWRALPAVLLCLWGLADSWAYFHLRHGDRPRWKEAYAWVQARRASGDLVFGMHQPVGEYYLDPIDPLVRRPEHVARLDRFHAADPERAWRSGRRAWLVVQPADLATWEAADRRRFEALLREDFTCQARFDVRGSPRDLLVEVYRSRTGPEPVTR